MKKLLTCAILIGIIGMDQNVYADETSIFKLRGECHQMAMTFYNEFEDYGPIECTENFLKGINYNAKDNKCYLEMETLQDKVVSDVITYHKSNKIRSSACQKVIDDKTSCMKKFLYDVQTKELIAKTTNWQCPFPNKDYPYDNHAYEQHGYMPSNAHTFLGWLGSMGSAYTETVNFIKSKMEENYGE